MAYIKGFFNINADRILIFSGDKPMLSAQAWGVGFLQWIARGQFGIEGWASSQTFVGGTVGRGIRYGVNIRHQSDLDQAPARATTGTYLASGVAALARGGLPHAETNRCRSSFGPKRLARAIAPCDSHRMVDGVEQGKI